MCVIKLCGIFFSSALLFILFRLPLAFFSFLHIIFCVYFSHILFLNFSLSSFSSLSHFLPPLSLSLSLMTYMCYVYVLGDKYCKILKNISAAPQRYMLEALASGATSTDDETYRRAHLNMTQSTDARMRQLWVVSLARSF